jgi:murein peptide amidase A
MTAGERRRAASPASSASGGPDRTLVILCVAIVLAIGILAMALSATSGVRHSSPPVAAAAQSEERSIGTSVNGSSITLVHFGDGPRRMLVIGGIHGNEYGAPVAEQLIAALRAEPSLVPTGCSIDVIPCLDPDGREAGTRGNARSVDINRNLPSANWSAELDARDTSAARGLNGGSAPASEPETKALLSVLEARYFAVVSLHSNGGLVDFDGPGAEALARRVATAAGLPVDHLAYQDYIHGSLGLYLAQTGTPLITVELARPDLTDGLRAGLLSLLAPR